MVPSRVTGGTAQSSSSSGIFYQEDGQSQVVGNSQLSSSFVNSSNPFPGRVQANLGPVSADVSNTVLNSVGSSGTSVGASSLVTDANSGLSGGPHLQRSASINTESYMRLPASPMSFSSNNISISDSSVMDGSSVIQQSSNQESGSQQVHQRQQHQGASSATSLLRMGQVQFPGGARVPNSFVQDPANVSHLQKKPRLDLKQEDIVQQQVVQQLLQRQDSHLQISSPQLQALIQQQRLRQQEQQLLQAMPPMQRVQVLQQQQQQQQLQLRQQLQVQGMPPASTAKRPYDGGVCSRRLMQYLYHQRQRPADNTIAYWRKFVAEYYSSRAKQRWCLSLYDTVGQHSLGVFPQAAMDAWQCDICCSKSGRGFEATFEVLPRLNEIKFGSGVMDELLFLDLPRECRFPSGVMMLECAKAVQESVYEQLRVVREGQLRIFFTPDLKILSWEFCAWRHEELLPRRLVAPQVNQLLQVAQRCQSTMSKSGADGISQQELQENSAMVVSAGRQLARSLELQSLNDLGFSKRYVRCLQIADVVDSMKDLMDFCRDQKKGPIDGLKSFPGSSTGPKAQLQKMQEMDHSGGLEGLPTDRNTLNKLMAMHPGLGSQMNPHQNLGGLGALGGSPQAALALTNYQNLLMRQNSMNSTNNNSIQPEGLSPFSTSGSSPTTPGPPGALAGVLQNSQMSGVSGCQSLPLQNNQALQQQLMQQYLQDMGRRNNSSMSVGFRNSNGPGVAQAHPPSRSNSFKAATLKSETTTANGHMGYGQKESDLQVQSVHIPEEMVPDIVHEFTENGFFNDDLDENMNFSWKA